jgi:translation initiation factor 3 subunit A
LPHSQDRTDRELVTPWFRFLWESHRSVLEILRTNPKLEALYAMAATRAFGFCLAYKRNAEFRRLCDILRQHLANMQKYRDTRDITAPESWSLHLETRFEQLRVACELEMWGEAFRSVEDIQNLISLGKRQPKQQLMAAYYSRLTQIFKV